MGNRPLPSGVTQEGDSLEIEHATRQHTGQYECHVSNAVGTETSIATLTIFCKYFRMICQF